MMFGRRQGEILFRPVVGGELVLAGDPPKWHPDRQARFVVGVDYGHGTDWVRDAFLNADCDSGAAFKRMYMGKWAVGQEPPVNDGPRYADINRSEIGASFDWSWPLYPKQREIFGNPTSMRLLDGAIGGGKTARLDDYYRDRFAGYAPPRPPFQAPILPVCVRMEDVDIDFRKVEGAVRKQLPGATEGEVNHG